MKKAELFWADAQQPPVVAPAGTTVFCHDAFYFLPDKSSAAQAFMQLASHDGQVLIGHAHNAAVDHGVAGSPLTPLAYADLFPNAMLYDDAELAMATLNRLPPPARSADSLAQVEAISLAWNEGNTSPGPWWDDLLIPPAGVPLRPNPLLHEREGRLEPDWPSPRFAEEYRGATYLHAQPLSPELARLATAGTGLHPDIDALARRRVLLDLPARW